MNLMHLNNFATTAVCFHFRGILRSHWWLQRPEFGRSVSSRETGRRFCHIGGCQGNERFNICVLSLSPLKLVVVLKFRLLIAYLFGF